MAATKKATFTYNPDVMSPRTHAFNLLVDIQKEIDRLPDSEQKMILSKMFQVLYYTYQISVKLDINDSRRVFGDRPTTGSMWG